MQIFKNKSPKSSRNDDWKRSGITRKYPTYRNSFRASVEGWIYGKRKDDEAEGLWRINDTLYDFSNFVNQHPGGAFWLQQTKGTDITEPFASHHISTLPESMLRKFEIREATQPRNYKLTMHENGFYKTLKKRVQKKLPELDRSPSKRTDLMHLTLLVSTFIFFISSAITHSILFEMAAALSLCWLSICAHNYFHKRDNWQMYTFNLTLMNVNDWRISHALSHHVYPNSLHDLELSMFEPFLCWLPNVHFASKVQRLISIVIQPIIYAGLYSFQFATRLVVSLLDKNVMYWHDVLGFILPLLMWLVSDDPFGFVLGQWFFILSLSSFIFSLIGINAAHHDPKIFHDGDTTRADMDWGLYQLDTIIDRSDIKGSQFLVLTHFGEHALHHLFPTLDHGILPQLYDVFFQTLAEFKVELRECNHLEHIIGQNQQLLRITPNPMPPGEKVER